MGRYNASRKKNRLGDKTPFFRKHLALFCNTIISLQTKVSEMAVEMKSPQSTSQRTNVPQQINSSRHFFFLSLFAQLLHHFKYSSVLQTFKLKLPNYYDTTDTLAIRLQQPPTLWSLKGPSLYPQVGREVRKANDCRPSSEVSPPSLPRKPPLGMENEESARQTFGPYVWIINGNFP